MICGYSKDFEKEKKVLEIGNRLLKNNIAFNVTSEKSMRGDIYYAIIYIKTKLYNTEDIGKIIQEKYPELNAKINKYSIEFDLTIKTNIEEII